MGGNVSIHTPRISFQLLAVLRRGQRQVLPGDLAHSQDALLPVMFHLALADHLCQFAGGVAAHAIHLEHPVLRSDKALRKKEIIQTAGYNGGKSVRVASHCDRGRQSRNL